MGKALGIEAPREKKEKKPKEKPPEPPEDAPMPQAVTQEMRQDALVRARDSAAALGGNLPLDLGRGVSLTRCAKVPSKHSEDGRTECVTPTVATWGKAHCSESHAQRVLHPRHVIVTTTTRTREAQKQASSCCCPQSAAIMAAACQSVSLLAIEASFKASLTHHQPIQLEAISINRHVPCSMSQTLDSLWPDACSWA